MKKFVVTVVLGLALLLMGLTLSAPAVTINPAPTGEASLDTVFNHILGVSTYTLAGLSAATPVETLSMVAPADFYTTYSLTDTFVAGGATFAGFTQNPGTNPGDTAVVTFIVSSAFPTTSGQDSYISFGPGGVSFTPTTDGSGNFGFADQYSNGTITGTVYTQAARNLSLQSQGLIFQVGTDEFMVCFEDGASFTGAMGDRDYNDLVLHVSRTYSKVPLPPTALLLGTCLLGLVGLGWRRRNKA